MGEYFRKLWDARADAAPTFDLISMLAHSEATRHLQPREFIGTIALFLGALYAPTTASDYAADRALRIRTFAVRFGVTRTLLFGFFLQVLSVAALAIGWSQRWFPFDGPGYDGMAELWPFLGLQVIFYAAFLRRPTVGRIWALLLFLSILQGLGVILMLWRFVGQRGWAP